MSTKTKNEKEERLKRALKAEQDSSDPDQDYIKHLKAELENLK